MDELRIDVQLVSPTDVFYQYHQAPEVTERIAQEANEEIAGMVRDHPDRFMGLGTLPMQDPERAVREMARGRQELGLTGFMIDDHVNGLTYDHDQFEPVWEAAEDLGVFLLIHQFQHTTVTYRTRKYFLLNSIGNLVDRTITFASFIYGGVLDRFPDSRSAYATAAAMSPTPWTVSTRGGTSGPASGASAGPAQLLCAAVLLRHGGLHAPQPAVPDRCGGGRPGHVRDRLAGSDDFRRPGRPSRDDGRALRRRAACAAPWDGANLFGAWNDRVESPVSPRRSRRSSWSSRSWMSAAAPRGDRRRRGLRLRADDRQGRPARRCRERDYIWMLGDTPIDEEVMDGRSTR